MSSHLKPLILFLLTSLSALGQQSVISGRVIDKSTGSPVGSARVFFASLPYNTMTNQNGEFSFRAPETTESALMVEAIPYQPVRVKIPKGSTKPLQIELSPIPIRRTYVAAQPEINAIVRSVIEKLPQNYHQKIKATTFHREYVTSFKDIIQWSESVVTHDQQSNASHSELRNAFYAEDKLHKELYWEAGSGFYTFGWQPIPGDLKPDANYFLGVRLKEDVDLSKYYTFTFPGSLHLKKQTLFVVNFDQKENIKGALLKGTMYIDSTSHAVVKLTYSISPKGIPYILPNRTIGGIRLCKPPLSLRILNESVDITYSKLGQKWYLSGQVTDTEFNAAIDSTQARTRDQYLKLHSEKVITSIDTIGMDAGVHPKKSTPPTHNYIKSHFESYDTSAIAWGWRETLLADTSVVKVVATLRSNNLAWERKAGRKAKDTLLAATNLRPEQLTKDLLYLKDMFNALHPGLKSTEAKADFNRMVQNTERHLQRNLPESEFIKYLSPIIESIHCGHTQLSPSAMSQEYNQKFGKFFPYDVTVFGRRAYLTENVADTARGTEILKVNGVTMSAILQSLRYKASTEGMSAAAKDHYLSKHFASLYAANYVQTDSFHLETKDFTSRKISSRTVAAVNYKLRDETQLHAITEIDSLQTMIIVLPEGLDDKSMKAFFDKVFTVVKQKAHSNVIIDLRDNEQFRDSYGAILYSYLSSDAFTYVNTIELGSADEKLLNELYVADRRLKDADPMFMSNLLKTDSSIVYNNHPNLNPYQHNPSAYSGNLHVLINGGSSSAAADFAAFTQLKKRGIVVGQDIHAGFHGSCNADEISIQLPNSRIRITLPLATFKVSGGEKFHNYPVVPDYAVQYSIADVVNRRDKELETSLRLIVENCCTAKSN
jgi:hypothetical protein